MLSVVAIRSFLISLENRLPLRTWNCRTDFSIHLSFVNLSYVSFGKAANAASFGAKIVNGPSREVKYHIQQIQWTMHASSQNTK